MKFFKSFRNQFDLEAFLSAVFLVGILLIIGRFMHNYIEPREAGIIIHDPILAVLPRVDVSWPTFIIIYPTIIFTFLRIIKVKGWFARSAQVYGLMVCFRMLCMWLTPLNPPTDIIILRDPFVEIFTESTPLTKDLFFSGHTASMFVCFLQIPGGIKTKIIIGIATVTVAILVLIQHVHYTIDVIGGFVFTYLAYRIVHYIQFKLKGEKDALNKRFARFKK